jgi:hypothetical protein
MCASVCPSGALWFGTREEMKEMRPLSRPVSTFQFGLQTITTRVSMMVPLDSPVDRVDVTGAMHEPTVGRSDAGEDALLANLMEGLLAGLQREGEL